MPQPTVNNPQPSTSPTPSDNDQPTPDTPAPSISPPTQPAPAPPPAAANDSIQAQVERWKNENGYSDSNIFFTLTNICIKDTPG